MAKKNTRAPKSAANDFWTYPGLYKAYEVAIYYGFMPSSYIEPEKADIDAAKSFLHDKDNLAYCEQKVALIRSYFLKNPSQSPVALIYETKAEKGHDKKKRDKTELNLDLLGTSRSISDATVIKAAYEIVKNEGFKSLSLEINSIGDRESFGRFTRDLTSFFRKHMNELHPECRQLFKKSPYSIITCSHEKCNEIKEHMPHPINFLSEPSRNHFMELLELLETAGIPYSLNNALIEHPDIASHTIFRILGQESEGAGAKEEVVASGLRYSGIAKKMGLKKDVPGISATILVPRKPKAESKTKKIRKPQIYFIQMGQSAKLKSLSLIEALRQAKIALYHSLTKDKLTVQLASAEYVKVPYILIMGQKESMENTILFREMSNRSQETINLDQIAAYLKNALAEQ
jgi:histidyl-tRNA synthetase